MSDTVSDPIHVLHVDDEPFLGDLVATHLERLDDRIAVTTETNAVAGFERIESDPIDCVVSDFQMPGTDGIAFLKRVRADFPNLPFILFTGRGSEDVASEAIEAGVTTYLQKDGTETYEMLANRVQNAVAYRRTQRRAQVAQDRLLDLYERTDGFFILDETWHITYWNQEMADRTGRSPAEVVGSHFLDAFPEAADTDLHDCYRSVMRHGEATRFETYFEPHDYWLDVRVHPYEGGLFVHSRDISDEKAREREVDRRNRILESFANTVSHDLRNPLNVADGRLQLAQETGDFEHLDGVAEAHNRMRNLIDELLRIARGDDLSLSPVSVAAGARDAWGTVSSGDATLVVEDDATISAHASQLRRLFENLFWNALDHGDATTLRVGVLDDGFYVADDGRGIPADERERVFEAGYTTSVDGTGYGLTLVTDIVHTHGWTVEAVESASGGARFEIRGVERA